MRMGWRLFGRNPRLPAPVTPDGAVAGPRKWLMVAVIVASSAALLGTSDDTSDPDTPGHSQFATTYTFERRGIPGGSVDLTVDQPHATFYINIRADALGTNDVVTTESVNVSLDGTITPSGFDTKSNSSLPYISFKVSSSGSGSGMQTQALDHYAQTVPVTFTGNCTDPTSGEACRTSVALEIARADEGSSGGLLHVDWKLDVLGRTAVPNLTENTTVGPSDPPWTIEVLR